MSQDQEAFDEAFGALVREDALDAVVRDLAAVGVVVEPWQRSILATWIWMDEDKPLAVRVLRLQRRLARMNIGPVATLTIADECGPL